MSLINQMLKDLEARRQTDGPLPHHPPHAGQTYPSPGKGGPRWLLMGLLGLPLLLLALLSGYLLWERQAQAPQLAVTSVPATVEAEADTPQQSSAPVRTEAVDTPVKIAEKPAPRAPVQPVVSPSTNQAKTVAAEERPLVSTNSPAARPQPAPTASTAPTAQPSEETQPIERRLRPPSPEQVAEQHYQQGYRLLQQARPQEGEEQWQQALLAHPPHTAAREGLVGLYVSQARLNEADELLQEGLRHSPGHGQFSLLRARLQLEQEQLAQAVQTLERGLQQQGQSADYLAFLAALYQRQQAYQQSIQAYQRALSMQPRQATWWMGLGISLEGARQNSEAQQAYREALDRGLAPSLQDYVHQRLRALR